MQNVSSSLAWDFTSSWCLVLAPSPLPLVWSGYIFWDARAPFWNSFFWKTRDGIWLSWWSTSSMLMSLNDPGTCDPSTLLGAPHLKKRKCSFFEKVCSTSSIFQVPTQKCPFLKWQLILIERDILGGAEYSGESTCLAQGQPRFISQNPIWSSEHRQD